MGVPIYTSHTILNANGRESVESVTIAQVDRNWDPVPGTEKSFACDTLLVAVGLDPVDEFYRKAKDFGFNAFAAGDADEIAEASAAMFSGKIRGLEIARSLGREAVDIPQEWFHTVEILKSKPGVVTHETIPDYGKVFPVLHCSQAIPCNPCTSVCSQGSIFIDEDDIRRVPDYIAQKLGKECIACEKCVTICPGLAITLVDTRVPEGESEYSYVTIPYEFDRGSIQKGDVITVTNTTGSVLGNVEVIRTRIGKATDHTMLVKVKAPRDIATRVAGIVIQEQSTGEPLEHYVKRLTDDMIVCRCERVSLQEIKDVIRLGIYDMNEIKTITRAGMGACGGKTCSALIKRAFRDLGIPMSEVTENTQRPLFIEVPLGILAGAEDGAK